LEKIMGHGRHVTGSSYEAPAAPAPVADYNVATNPALSPDCSCNYFYFDEYDGRPSYRRGDGLYFIYYDAAQEGIFITANRPATFIYWSSDTGNIIGNYTPRLGAIGIAVVSAGPH
jgi:hypothetical protein